MSTSREQVERTADRIRDELMITLGELDRRRREATDLGLQARRHAPVLAGAALGLAGVITGIVLLVRGRARRRVRRRAERRWDAAKRAWRHPERVAVHGKDQPLPVELAKKLVTSFALAFGIQLARRVAHQLLPTNPRAR